jgi:hypothetical protein
MLFANGSFTKVLESFFFFLEFQPWISPFIINVLIKKINKNYQYVNFKKQFNNLNHMSPKLFGKSISRGIGPLQTYIH